MTPIPLDIVGSTKFARYPKISREITYNMMISDEALIPYPGYKKIKDILPGGSEGRAIYSSSKFNHLIVVIDNGVYSISSDYAIARVGTIDTSTGDVFISENNASQIMIAENTSKIYVFNYLSESFTSVDVGFLAGAGTFIDGYILEPELDTHQWRLSALNNALSFPFDAQHVGEMESKPDVVVACETLERQVFIFGKNVTEVWLDIPSSSLLFPFQRQNSISIEYGCISPNSIASNFQMLVWLGANESSGPTILVSTGGKPHKIDTDGISFELERLKKPEDSYGFLFKKNGHIFYQITFPSDNVSYAYDFNEGKFFNVSDHLLNAHIARKISYFNSTYLFITSKDGGLYEFSDAIYTYNETLDPAKAQTVPRVRITSPKRLPGADRFIVNNIALTIDQGYSNEDLDVHLSLSKDGGQSFGTIWSQQLKKMGKRPNKLNYRKLGAANDLTVQFKFWGKDRFTIIGADIEVLQ